MRLTRSLLVAGLLSTAAGRAYAQGGIAAQCAAPGVPEECYVVAQAVESAQPQLGILIAGGNPTLGTASGGGLRLGVLPRVSASANLNVVFIRLPEILAEQVGGTAQRLNEVAGIPAPALSGTVTVGVFPGFSAIPTIGGIGSLDLIGTATWLPLSSASSEGFESGAAAASYGAGVRIGVMRESFVTPGISVSVIRRSLGDVGYGDICPGSELRTGNGPTLTASRCLGEGDPGEFGADLTDWSTRAAIGKRLLGLGLTAGVGYDRFSSDVRYGFRAPENTPVTQPNAYRLTGLDLDANRWSAFLDASFTLLVATVGAEAGWLQGADAIEGFPETSDFDPGKGTFFGSVGVRVSL
jgi:hypothetical protein